MVNRTKLFEQELRQKAVIISLPNIPDDVKKRIRKFSMKSFYEKFSLLKFLIYSVLYSLHHQLQEQYTFYFNQFRIEVSRHFINVIYIVPTIQIEMNKNFPFQTQVIGNYLYYFFTNFRYVHNDPDLIHLYIKRIIERTNNMSEFYLDFLNEELFNLDGYDENEINKDQMVVVLNALQVPKKTLQQDKKLRSVVNIKKFLE